MSRRRLARAHARLVAALDRALGWAGDGLAFEARVEVVSGWGVGQHLEHLLRSDRVILGWIEATVGEATWRGGTGPAAVIEPGPRRSGAAANDGRPADGSGRGRPTWAGRIVLLTGFIRRGKGRTPDLTTPTGLSRKDVE